MLQSRAHVVSVRQALEGLDQDVANDDNFKWVCKLKCKHHLTQFERKFKSPEQKQHSCAEFSVANIFGVDNLQPGRYRMPMVVVILTRGLLVHKISEKRLDHGCRQRIRSACPSISVSDI